MHIFYPIGSFYPAQSGGPSNSVYWLAKALVGQGTTVTVVATDMDQTADMPRDQWIQHEAGRVRYVSTRLQKIPLRHISVSLRVMAEADIVHLTSLFYPLSMVLGTVALWRGCQVVWSPRGELAPAALAIRPRLKRLMIRFFRRWAAEITFHATSADEAGQIRQWFGNAVRVIELPNYLELPVPIAAPTPVAPGYLLYLGRLHPIKALDRLLEATALSPVFRNGGWQLRLVGSDTVQHGPLLKQLVDKLGLHKQVRFEPPITGEAKQHLLANAYALVLPSHTENFGNVVIEALAQGTPVIASTGTPWAVLPKTGAGFWTANESAALAVTLDQCLSLPSGTYAQYRQQAIRLAQRQYDITTNSHRWLAAYDDLLTVHFPKPLCAE